MSSLRGRTRDSSWQWLIIGVVLGLGCSSVACLGTYAAGLIKLNVPGIAVADNPTPTIGSTQTPNIMIITATAAPTNTVLPVTTAAPAVQPADQSPSPTSFVPVATSASQSTEQVAGPTQPVVVVGTNLAPPTLPPVTRPAIQGTQSAAPGVGITLAPAESQLPPDLSPSEMATINGGVFTMGTTQKEALQAVDDCVTRDKAKCEPDFASDSIGEHSVTLDSFQIEKTEVSYDQYLAFLNSLTAPNKTACGGSACVAVQDNAQYKASYIKLEGTTYKLTTELYHDRPVAFVTWYGADAYCKSIKRRLPTEAEWERAARAPTDNPNRRSIYPWGDAWDGTKANTSRPPQNGPLPIDKYASGATPEGVVNLAGNVAEWVSDYYDPNYYKTTDTSRFVKPKGPAKGTQKVVRGGSWASPPFFARSVNRQSFDPGDVQPTIGFRCAADAPANAQSSTNGGSTGATGGQSVGITPTKKGTLAPNP